MKLSGMKASYQTLILAAIFDQVSVIRWLQTKDGAKGQNRPKPIVPDLLDTKTTQETQLFGSGKEFEEARRKVIEKCRQ